MLEPLHQSVELPRAAALCCKLLQPFAEHGIYRLMPGFGQQARLLDQLFVCTERNVSIIDKVVSEVNCWYA
jgi:hypothetical protein